MLKCPKRSPHSDRCSSRSTRNWSAKTTVRSPRSSQPDTNTTCQDTTESGRASSWGRSPSTYSHSIAPSHVCWSVDFRQRGAIVLSILSLHIFVAISPIHTAFAYYSPFLVFYLHIMSGIFTTFFGRTLFATILTWTLDAIIFVLFWYQSQGSKWR